ncbi:hypothetical protein ABPG72_018531 [Tetrahymena utriculariae]
MFYYQNWNHFYSNAADYSLSYSTAKLFDIRNYTRKKESEINVLKLNLQSESRCLEFDYFSRYIKRIPKIKEIEISIDIRCQKEKANPDSRIKEVLDFVIDTIFPQYQDTLETITFTQIQIQEKSERDEEKTIKKYLLKMLQPLKALKIISFRQNENEVKSSNFYGLKQFVLLLQEQSLALPNLKLLDFEFSQTQNQLNLKSFNQKEILTNMLVIAKYFSKLNQLEELQIGIQNLGLERVFFDFLIQSIAKMKNLKKLGLDISSNRITPENSVKNIKQLKSLSNQLENFIYIDSQNLKPANIKQFSQAMRNFQNLKCLQLEQFYFRQGNCRDFFSFFPFMPQLEEIKLDLESIDFSTTDYDQFVKYLKQLENLSSIQLTLSEKNRFLPESIVLNLIDLITYFKDQLLDLSLIIYSDIGLEESVKLIDAISNMEKLKYIQFKFPNLHSLNDSVTADARKQNAENIWSLKSVDSLAQEYQYQNFLNFLILLKFRIIVQQNAQILEDMKIIQYQFAQMQKLDQLIYNELVEVKKFTNLKSLIHKSNNSAQSFIHISNILISNNLNSLTFLILYNSFNLSIDQMLQIVRKCKFLYYLDIQISSVSNEMLDSIFTELVYLQKLSINQNNFFSIDETVFENANYLTDFNCSFVDNFNIMNKMIQQRKVYILQNLIYAQIIQPQIIYQPQFSHLDIVID